MRMSKKNAEYPSRGFKDANDFVTHLENDIMLILYKTLLKSDFQLTSHIFDELRYVSPNEDAFQEFQNLFV